MGIFDDLFGSPEEDAAAEKALREGRWAIEGLPPLVMGQIDPEQGRVIDQAQVRGYDPTFIEGVDPVRAVGFDAATVDRSAFEDIEGDPRLRQAQLDALSELQEVGRQGGLTAQDRSRLEQIRNQTATADRGRRDAIMQNMRARGMGGSGNELLAQLQSAQAATDQASAEGLGVEAMAEQRKMDAIMGAGQLGGSIRGQDFGEASTVAGAQDALSKFNAANTQQARQFYAGAQNSMNDANANRTLGTQQFNATAGNRAAEFGANARNEASLDYTGRAQGVQNAYAGARNQAQVQNRIETPKAQWGAGFQRANALGEQSGRETAFYNSQGDRKTKQKAGAWEAGGKAGAAIIAAMSDERKKEEKKPVSLDDLQEFLGAVKPATFRYKDPSEDGALPGKRVGFMAQDVKDTKLGKDLISEREDGTLQYDTQNLQGILLAALKELAEGKQDA